jgi:hypothetical protein
MREILRWRGRGTDVAGQELAQAGGHAADHHAADHHEHEPVVAPDQLKQPPFRRLWIFGGAVTIIVLVLMAFFGNHRGNVEKVFLVGIAAVMLLGGIVAYFLKKLGLRN